MTESCRNGPGIGRLSRHRCLLFQTAVVSLVLAAPGTVSESKAERIERSTGESELLILRRAAESEDAADTQSERPAYEVEVSDATWREFVGDLRSHVESYASLERRLPGQSNELPPVHFHRKYFDVAKEYQGPLIAGGLTVLVAHHPSTRAVMRVPVVLPTGTPVIVYRKSSITYVYDDRRVIFRFEPSGQCGVCVEKKDGIGTRANFQRLRSATGRVGARVRSGLHRTPLTESVRNNARLVRDTAVGAAGTALTLASMWVDKVGQAAEALPGVKTLRSAGERKQQGEGQIEQLRQSGLKAGREIQQFRRTIR